jgi:acyl carrier protein
MIGQEHRDEIIEIFEMYKNIRENISSVEKLVKMLEEKQELLHEQLTNNRNREKDLINKIEKELGRKIMQEELLEILEKK